MQVEITYAKLDSRNYEGRDNYYKYDLMIQATGIDDGVITNTKDFKIYLEGKSCKRNIFTTFTYDLQFTLKKDGVYNNSINVYFKIKDKDDVPGSIKTIFSGPFDNGNYTLIVKGKIKSNVTVDINRTYNFKVSQ